MKWEMKNMGDLCSLVNGKAYKASDWTDSGLPIIRIQNLNDSTKPFNHWNGGLERQVHIQKGDFLIAWSGTPGTSFGGHIWQGPEGVLNQHIFRVDLLNDNVTREWLKFCVNIQLLRLIDQAHGGVGLKHVTKRAVQSIPIPLPPLEEQKRIAGILDAADILRVKRREALAKLDDLLQSTFLDLFGDPVTNPKGWEVKSLGELATNEDGKRVPVKKADREAMDGEYPYYGASGIIDYVNDYLFDGERLLIGEDGANLVARSTPIAFMAKGKYWVNNHAHVLASNGKSELLFLEAFVNAIDLKPFLSGTAQPKLNQKKLNQISVPTPPLDLQQRFAKIVSSVEEQKAKMRKHLEQLDDLFASLQQRAFRGDL